MARGEGIGREALSAATKRVGMWWGEGVAVMWVEVGVVDVNDLMGLLPKSAVMVSPIGLRCGVP
jgi:hypothetical protein